MVSNPFSEGVAVNVTGETSGAQTALANLRSQIGLTKSSAVALGGVMAGALATAGLGAAVNAASNFEDAMVEVQKVTDETTAEQLAGPIRELATEIPLAQDAIAGLTADAARFGIEGTENIQNFAETAAQMGFATDLSAEQAGESLARLAQLTGTPTEEINNLGSSIAVLGNNFATSEQEIVDSMLRSSAAMASLGLNQTEMAGLSTALNEVSESSERAGSRLRRLGQELLDPAKVGDLSSALGMTEEEFRNMRDSNPAGLMQQMAESFAEGGDTAENLRGVLTTTSQQAIAGLSQNLDGLNDALDKSNSGYEEATALQEETDAQTETFSSQVQILRNELTNIGIEIGNVLLPHLTSLVSQIGNAVEVFAEWNESTNGLLGTGVLLAGVLAGVVAVVGSAISMMGGLGAIVATIVAPFSGFVGILSTLLGPLTAALGIFSPLIGVLGSLLAPITGLIGSIGALLGPLGTVGSLALTILGPIAILGAAIAALGFLFQNHGDLIKSSISNALDFLTEAIQNASDWLLANAPGLIGDAFEAIGAAIRFVFLDLKKAFTGGDSIIADIIYDIADFLKTNGPTILKTAAIVAFEGIIAAAKGLYRGLIGNSIIPEMFEDIKDFIKNDALKMMVNGAITFITTVLAVFERGFNTLFNVVSGVFEDIVGLGADVLDILPDKVTSKLGISAEGLRDFEAPTRETNLGAIQQQREQQIRIVLDEQTDIVEGRIENGANKVVNRRERRADRLRDRGSGVI